MVRDAANSQSSHNVGKAGTNEDACCMSIWGAAVSPATVPLLPALALAKIEPLHMAFLVQSRSTDLVRPPSTAI